MSKTLFANIAIPPLDTLFTYKIPESLRSIISIGCKVSVPFRSREAAGYVVEVHDRVPTLEAKEIYTTLPTLCFNEESLWLYEWVSEYYGETLSKVIETGIPPIAKEQPVRIIHLVQKEASLRGSTQKDIISFISSKGDSVLYKDLLSKFPKSSAALKTLLMQGIISSELSPEIIAFDQTPIPDWVKHSVDLNTHQQKALDHILSKSANPILLHGETGSGKTEVYIEAASKVISEGGGVLVLVPEIALTPQLIDRFKARLGSKIALLHSGLPARVRWHSWRALLEDKTRIAIGARSALFAPVQNLKLIIIDEEHDGSYKQSEGLRYHARDAALMLAKKNNATIVLGSATPSLESFARAEQGQFEYLTLPAQSAEHQKLQISLVDLTRSINRSSSSKFIGEDLQKGIKETLERKEQVLLLYNRRGFSTFLQCTTCGQSLFCPNCSVTLTYHRTQNRLVCHYCNFSMTPPSQCPKCPMELHDESRKNQGKLIEHGAGTEKIVEELTKIFPSASIDRLDRDAVDSLSEYRETLHRIRSGKTDILVGTQMIAKGHDIPSVTLVGIVNADIGLHMPDFRASERTFQLLTQAAGRAGRGDLPGKVILQTRLPEHPSISHTISRDYVSFARAELKGREALGYPPFKRLLRIITNAEIAEEGSKLLEEFRDVIERYTEEKKISLSILGPTSCPIEKIKRSFRHHILIKASKPSELILTVRLLKSCKWPKNIKVQFDMDPQDML